MIVIENHESFKLLFYIHTHVICVVRKRQSTMEDKEEEKTFDFFMYVRDIFFIELANLKL